VTALAELGSSRDLLVNLTLREVRSKYKRTVLGQVWSLLNPIAQMATYSIVFAFVLKAKPDKGDPSGLDCCRGCSSPTSSRRAWARWSATPT